MWSHWNLDNVCSKNLANFRFSQKEQNPPAYNLTVTGIIPDDERGVRHLDPSVLAISLSLHRHPFVSILFISRFTCYNKSISLTKGTWPAV